MTHIPTGKFRLPDMGDGFEGLAYVTEGLGVMIPEREYRARGYEPPFDILPTLDEYEAAAERFDEVTSSGNCSDAESRPKDRRPMH